MTTVSVITGFYNRGHLLDRTLASLLDQKFDELEIIVFDDCSNDNTRERLKKYQEKNDPRLKIILHEKNKGFTQGMIDAIHASKGEYIAVQGSGDASVSTRIVEQAALLDREPEIGVVGSYYENIVESTSIVRLRTPSANNATLESLSKGNVFTHGEVMFRRAIYERVGGYRPEFKYCQDYDLWLRMIRLCRFGTVPKMLYKRYIQFEGVSYEPKKASVQARYFILCQRMASMSKVDQEKMVEKLALNGPKAIISDDDPVLQKRLFRNALRQIVWGNAEQAKRMGEYIPDAKYRFIIDTVASVFMSPIFSVPKKILFRYFGIQAN